MSRTALVIRILVYAAIIFLAYCEELGVPWQSVMWDSLCRSSFKTSDALWKFASYSQRKYSQKVNP